MAVRTGSGFDYQTNHPGVWKAIFEVGNEFAQVVIINRAINGTVYYHDLGKFIADFENSFPHSRMVRLVVEPAASTDSHSEKLSFKMEIITLMKPNPSQSNELVRYFHQTPTRGESRS